MAWLEGRISFFFSPRVGLAGSESGPEAPAVLLIAFSLFLFNFGSPSFLSLFRFSLFQALLSYSISGPGKWYLAVRHPSTGDHRWLSPERPRSAPFENTPPTLSLLPFSISSSSGSSNHCPFLPLFSCFLTSFPFLFSFSVRWLGICVCLDMVLMMAVIVDRVMFCDGVRSGFSFALFCC